MKGRTAKVYYNEIDPACCAWLKELMTAGLIPEGDIDSRSIRDVKPDEVRHYEQRHWFAGIGGWPNALGLAGWGERPCDTGSCPCQPYSSAGKQKGDDDPRNLWPEMFRLIRECRPDVVFGEQVPGAIRHGWLDGVSDDLEGEGYAVGACVLGAFSVGAPHIRQRLYWVANSGRAAGQRYAGAVSGAEAGIGGARVVDGDLSDRLGDGGPTGGLADAGRDERGAGRDGGAGQRGADEPTGLCVAGGLGDALCVRRGQREHPGDVGRETAAQPEHGRQDGGESLGGAGPAGGLEHPEGDGRGERRPEPGGRGAAGGRGVGGMGHAGRPTDECLRGPGEASGAAGPTSGEARQRQRGGVATGADGPLDFWSDYDLIPCRDGKVRRIPRHTQPGVLGVVDGLSPELAAVWAACAGGHPLVKEKVPGRVGLLRGYGNAICPYTAAAFIRAFLEGVGP